MYCLSVNRQLVLTWSGLTLSKAYSVNNHQIQLYRFLSNFIPSFTLFGEFMVNRLHLHKSSNFEVQRCSYICKSYVFVRHSIQFDPEWIHRCYKCCYGIICLVVQPLLPWHSSTVLLLSLLRRGSLGALLLPVYDRAQVDMR